MTRVVNNNVDDVNGVCYKMPWQKIPWGFASNPLNWRRYAKQQPPMNGLYPLSEGRRLLTGYIETGGFGHRITKMGSCLYIARHPTGPRKLGYSDNPESRIEDIRRAHKVRLSLEWESSYLDYATSIERIAQYTLAFHRQANVGIFPREFFNVTLQEALSAINNAVMMWEDHGPKAFNIMKGSLSAERSWSYSLHLPDHEHQRYIAEGLISSDSEN